MSNLTPKYIESDIDKMFNALISSDNELMLQFQKYIKDLPQDTLFIADEAHNIGSPSVLNSLTKLSLQNRIGLSATPKRIYDFEGSIAMEGFFNDKEPYTYSFSMERAIEEGILCKYYYYPIDSDDIIYKLFPLFVHKSLKSFKIVYENSADYIDSDIYNYKFTCDEHKDLQILINKKEIAISS